MPVVVRSEGNTDASPVAVGLTLSETATRLAIAGLRLVEDRPCPAL